MATKIKCVLIKDSQLGQKNEVVLVNRGYARNCLIPGMFAIPATKGNIKTANENKKQGEKKINERREEAFRISKKLENIILEYKNEGSVNKISVTSADIAKLIHEATGQEITKDNIILEEKINKAGEYNIKINLFSDVSMYIKLIVKNKETKKS